MLYRRRWLAVSCVLLGAGLAPLGWLGAACGGGPSLVVRSCMGEGGIDALDCFSNYDCHDPTSHCGRPDASDPSTIVTCCIPGARGTGDAGVSCTSADDCVSAVCAYTTMGPICSTLCQTPADCPSNLPTCFDAGVVVDGGMPQSFCGP